MEEERTELDIMAEKALNACYDYWKLYTRLEREKGIYDNPVVWLKNDENGHFMVFTRGEYSDKLKDCIMGIPTCPWDE